jgi:osmoprotectant transport system substrate-binding protein
MRALRFGAVCAAAAALLAACDASKPSGPGGSSATTSTTRLPGQGRPPVTVGDTNIYPEQFVLGALYEQALKAKGYTVSLNRNIGPPEVRLKALQDSSVDMYPEYIDTWDSTIAGYTYAFASPSAAYRAGERYAVDHGLKLLRPTPFSDTDALATTLTYAIDNSLSAIGDLRKVASKLTVGGPPQFQTSSPGLTLVEQTYRFAPVGFKTLPVGEQYAALDQNSVQAADVNTTDGQLASGDYVLLSDPAHVFGWGNVVPVVSQAALEVEGPAFVSTINEVSALLTTRVMRELNADVAVLGEDPAKVAAQFLQAHGLAPSSQTS